MNIRVIIADDHPAVRHGVRRILSRYEDIEVIGEAETGEQAIWLVEKFKPDVLLLDIELPDIKGFEVARRLTEAHIPTRTLALSAYSNKNYIRSMLTYGAAGYLTKEEVPYSIIQAIRSIAKGDKKWLSPRVIDILKESH
jgi:two-component system, NarL family, response regulator DegU